MKAGLLAASLTLDRETAANAALLGLMEGLRKYQPRITFAKPNIDD